MLSISINAVVITAFIFLATISIISLISTAFLHYALERYTQNQPELLSRFTKNSLSILLLMALITVYYLLSTPL